MTMTPLLTDPAPRLEGQAPSDDSGPAGRWVLHRAGVVNVWQYDRVELRFAGGRLLLRGKNGAGKSKALEILLPFLLDGDTRRLDATGRDRTTITWLMTDGRPQGNHVGYVWLELRCGDPDGAERFLTLGAGLKASTATRRGDAWFFMTERRVGVDLELDRAGECLSVDRLKETIGDEAVTSSGVEHRRRVGRHVFGMFDDARYANLLHLLHRLRDPNIGNRVEAGELASVLTDALPPVDETVLTDAAGRFDDLDAIREQVDRAQHTADALGQFLGTYRGYTRTVLRRRADAVMDAESARAKATRAARQADRAEEEAERAVATASEAVEARRGERVAAEDDRRALERSDAYRAHQDLVDRQARVDALRVAASTADAAADRARAAAVRAADEVGTADLALAGSLGEAQAAGDLAAGLAVAAGLDRNLLGPLPARGADGSLSDDVLAAAGDRARGARVLAETRQRRAEEVRVLAVLSERAGADADAADQRAAASEADVDSQRGALNAARATRTEAEQQWTVDVREWMAAGLAGSCGADWTAVRTQLDRRGDVATWTDDVGRAVAEALTPVVRDARAAAAAAQVRATAAEEAREVAESRVVALEAQTEARPEPNRYRDAERDPAAGAPLYELVDLAPAIDVTAATGIEAALEASGLLDAWVSADGLVVHPRTHDTIVRADAPARPAPDASLAAVLQPAVPDDGPVAMATVQAVLASIGLGEQPDARAWVADDGRWSLGLLHGAWAKPTVEFIGAGARLLTRQRRLAELRVALADAEAALAKATGAAVAAAERRDAFEVLPASLPAADSVEAAGRDVLAAERAVGAARARHDADRRAAEQARAVASRLGAALAHEASGDGLPTAVDALDDVIAAVGELRQTLGDHRRALAAIVGDHQRLTARLADQSGRDAEAADADDEAGVRRADHASADHELATLRDALGATVGAVLSQLAHVVDRIERLDHDLVPAAESAYAAAVRAHATATAALDGARAAEQAAVNVLDEAGRAMAQVVVLPGLMLAATGHDDELRETGVGLARAVLPLVDGDDDVADSTILARYDRLNQALAGGYDTAIEEIDGVKVVHVDDDNGRQPLAAVAIRVVEEAQAARGRLAAREREVLERFLLRELADEVRGKLLDAHDQVAGTNRTLAGVRTSHGKGARLEWILRDDAAAPAAVAARLLVDELRGDDGDARLRDALLALIETERAADPTASYEQHLRTALDYRAWHRFAVKVSDVADPGSGGRLLSNRLGLSQGEQRVLSYLALFAAAAAQFEAIARHTPEAPRLLLLDDAFAKVDEPTHGHLLGLLVKLGLDFVLTSERLWGCFETVPSLEIYEAIREPTESGVALMHFHWDGHHRSLVGV